MEEIKHFASSSMFATESARKFFEHEERYSAILDQFFWNAFDYLRANAVAGDYTEFGSGFLVRSFRLAAKYKSLLYASPRLFAFDSFTGLPPITADDDHPGWHEGSMAVSIAQFRSLLKLQGVQERDYHVVPGLFQSTLIKPPAEYGLRQVAFAFVDCDLYQSTQCVLPFINTLLVDGAILAFDDWNCYKGDPSKGQRRAFNESFAEQKDISFQPFLSFGWHGQSFLVRRLPR